MKGDVLVSKDTMAGKDKQLRRPNNLLIAYLGYLQWFLGPLIFKH